MTRYSMAVLLALTVLSGSASAGDPEGGIAAARTGDYAKAAALLRPLAEQGNSDAQYLIALMYSTGTALTRSEVEAAKWMRRAAESGHVAAQVELASMYTSGRGLPQNYAEAVRWYRLSAAKGSPYAQLGLADAYAKGRGAPQDYVLAHMWANLAGASLVNSSDVASARELREALAKQMTVAQITEAQSLATAWKPEIGEPGANGLSLDRRLLENFERRSLEEYGVSVARAASRTGRYPRRAQMLGWQGTTEVLVRMGTDGKVKGVSIAKSSGYDVLDEEALKTVRGVEQLPPPPEHFRGREFTVMVPIVFALE